MIRQNPERIDPKRRNVISHKKKQFADATYKQQEYPHRLNFYDVPPTKEITLEEFEQWAIDRLRGMYPVLRFPPHIRSPPRIPLQPSEWTDLLQRPPKTLINE